MKLTVNAFRRIKKIEITISDTVTLIAGKIEQGKTSLLHAIGAVTTSESMLSLLGLTQKNALLLLHTGQPKATIISETGDGMSGISFPENKRVSEGTPLEISVWASGLKNILDEPLKTRSEIMSKILKSEPDQKRLFEELGKFTNSLAGNARLWDTIQVQGWDAAHEQAKTKGIELKRDWRNVTGINYGSNKSDGWVPDTWDFDLTNAIEEDLQNAVDEEKQWLEIAIASETIDELDNAKIEDAKKRLPELEGKLKIAESYLSRIKTSYQATKTAINTMPEAKQPVIQKCPNCSIDLSIIDGKIQKYEAIEEDIIEQRKKEIDDLKKSLAIIDSEIETSNKNIIEIKSEISECKKIIDAPAAGEKSDSIKQPKATAEDCRQYLKKAEDRLSAFRAKKSADAISGRIKLNQKIIDILAPDGLRLVTLESKMKEFNSLLAKISNISGWGEIYLNKDMTINHRGWPYPLLISGSAQWRVRLAMQIAIAQVLGDSLVLIDGADILDSENRNSLIKLLIKLKLRAVIAMTVDSKEKLPNLEKVGGVGYWIEDGVIR
jgi:hypothetical protein